MLQDLAHKTDAVHRSRRSTSGMPRQGRSHMPHGCTLILTARLTCRATSIVQFTRVIHAISGKSIVIYGYSSCLSGTCGPQILSLRLLLRARGHRSTATRKHQCSSHGTVSATRQAPGDEAQGPFFQYRPHRDRSLCRTCTLRKDHRTSSQLTILLSVTLVGTAKTATMGKSHAISGDRQTREKSWKTCHNRAG
jgi:hypothetical protein